MKAMILAAGVGRRLRPLTDEIPKALVDVGGVPMIERVVRRLQEAGVTEIAVNLFHLGDRIVEFLASKQDLGLRIAFMRETQSLDSERRAEERGVVFDDGWPFFVHNADVLSDIDLTGLSLLPPRHWCLGDPCGPERPSSCSSVRLRWAPPRPGYIGRHGVGERIG